MRERYRVEEVLAENVYRVHDGKFNTDWCMRQTTVLPGFVEAAEKWAQLRHPGLAQIVDSFVDEDSAFVVTEWARGQTLQAKLDAMAPLPPDEVVELGTQLLDVLYFLHTSNHELRLGSLRARDIWLGQDGTLKLTEYGLGASTASHDDLQAAAAVLYYAACGREAGAPTPKPPSEVHAGVPTALSQVIMKALSGGYPDVGEFKHDLMAVAEQFAPEASPSAGAVASIAAVSPAAASSRKVGCLLSAAVWIEALYRVGKPH